MKTTARSLLLLALIAPACGGAAETTPAPATPAAVPTTPPAPAPAPTAHREEPPASGTTKEFTLPKPTRKTLANGLEIETVESHALPIVQLRVFVRAGKGYGGIPGVAHFTAQMLKDGGTKTMTSARLLERVESLGANLGVETGFDGTTLSLGVLREHLGEALKILAEVVREPRFDEAELKKLKDRETDEARDNARGSGTFMVTREVFRELFTEANPYASFAPVPSEIAKIAMPRLRDFHKRFYVPKNTKLIIAGDVDPAVAAKASEDAFGGWAGGEPPKIEFPAAIPPAKTRVVLADRPKSAQSDVLIVMLAPPRSTPTWPQIRVANHILGGGMASRLFLDVREQRSLAYHASSAISELANGQQPIHAYAGTQTPKTGLAVKGLLENLEKMAMQEVTQAETESARRSIFDTFAIRLETIGSVANLLVTQETLKLPDGYWDTYRGAVRTVDAKQATATAQKLFVPERALIVVAGDAEKIAPMLTHFGEVTIVNPEKEFETVKTLPANPAAPIE